ncbi:MAG: hypothetical protein RL745_743 [Actinomycetota bacterium]
MLQLLIATSCGLGLGCVLGLLGGGGGLIAVPLFAAVFGWSIDKSGTASLVCVFIGSAVAVATHLRTGRLRIRESVMFGLIGTAAAVAGSLAAFAIPDVIQHAVLASLLVTAGALMFSKARRLRRGDTSGDHSEAPRRLAFRTPIVLSALGIGFVVGVLGISGGFLTVPAFTALLGMTVPQASASALLVVMINTAAALAARAGRIEAGQLISVLAAATAIGAIAGARLARRTSAVMLAVLFGSLILAIAAWEAWRTVTMLHS